MNADVVVEHIRDALAPTEILRPCNLTQEHARGNEAEKRARAGSHEGHSGARALQ
jgi:hypothetical protein